MRWGAARRVLSAALVLGAAGMSATAALAQAAPINGVGSQFELVYWQSVAATDDPAQIGAYLSQYPNGTFGLLARAKLAALDRHRTFSSDAAVVEAAPKPLAASQLALAAPVVSPPIMPSLGVGAPAVMDPAVSPPAAERSPDSFAAETAKLGASSPPPVVGPTVAAVAAMPAASSSPPIAVPATAPAPPAVALAAAASAPEMSLSDQLRALGQSQAPRSAVPAVDAVGLVPPRPQLARLSGVHLPQQFCSAAERNSFYDTDYKPALDAADQNNQTAIAYLHRLKQLYDEQVARSAPESANVLAAEAKDYEPVAAAAFEARSAYDAMFGRLMSVPLTKCPSVQ